MDRPWLNYYDDDVPRTLAFPSITVPEMLAQTAEKYPNQIASIFVGGRLTYAQLKTQVDQLASALSELGIRQGDRVAIMLPNCPQAIIAYYATLSLGAVTVLTNPLYVEKELERQWGDAGVKAAIFLNIFWPKVKAVREALNIEHLIATGIQEYMSPVKGILAPIELRRQGNWVSIPKDSGVHSFKKLANRRSRRSPHASISPEDLACLQYTGGTTGLPKGAMLSHKNLVAGVYQIRQFLLAEHKETEDKAIAIMPIFHVYGMNAVMNLAVRLAATQVLLPRPEIKDVVDAIVSEKPTFFLGVPALYVALMSFPTIDNIDLTTIKACFSGGSPLPMDVIEQFEKRTGSRIAEAYGMTETASVTHVNPRRGVHKHGSIGVPITGTEARIVDVEDGNKDVPQGEAGELLIKGPTVMMGYWNRPDETAQVLKDGWLCTGDIATMDEDGYFYIVDRKKDLILTAGFNVYPREVEEVLYKHPKVLEAAVVGLPDAVRGEKITAYVTLKPGEKATAAEIRAFCRKHLAPYKQPRTVVFQDNLPKSMAGKILRRKLREDALAAQKKTTVPK
ncbi:MAG: long-chain fatty acid--CoA ligase [Anaerolineae bacterium]